MMKVHSPMSSSHLAFDTKLEASETMNFSMQVLLSKDNILPFLFSCSNNTTPAPGPHHHRMIGFVNQLPLKLPSLCPWTVADLSVMTQVRPHPWDLRNSLNKALKDFLLLFDFLTWPLLAPPKWKTWVRHCPWIPFCNMVQFSRFRVHNPGVGAQWIQVIRLDSPPYCSILRISLLILQAKLSYILHCFIPNAILLMHFSKPC